MKAQKFLKIVIIAIFGLSTLLAIILLIQKPKDFDSYTMLASSAFFDIVVYLLFFKKSSLLYKRFHERPKEED